MVSSDEKGRLTILSGIDKEEGVSMKIVDTPFTRFKAVKVSPDFQFLSAITNEGLAVWDKPTMEKEIKDNAVNELISKVRPHRQVTYSQRLLCLGINIIKEAAKSVFKKSVKNKSKE